MTRKMPDAVEIPLEHLDKDGDGHVDPEELREFLDKKVSDADRHVDHIFRKGDRNRDGKLDPHEFRHVMERRAIHFARLVVLPKSDREKRDQVDGEYEDQFSCCPPPIFFPTISAVIIGIWAYHTHGLIQEKGWIGINGPPPIDSVLIYNPYKRHEAWRFFTYMFVHSGYMHIASNVIMQLFLGLLLEMVHKWWRVMLVYFAGVIAGSLATSLSDPGVFLAGASGGVYALITAHLATVIMNWNEMEMPWIQVISFTAFSIIDIGTALYYRYIVEEDHKIGYVAHIGGALAGLLVGIYTLKNIRRKAWEDRLWWAMVILSAVLFAVAIGWNVFYTSHFPPLRYD